MVSFYSFYSTNKPDAVDLHYTCASHLISPVLNLYIIIFDTFIVDTFTADICYIFIYQ